MFIANEEMDDKEITNVIQAYQCIRQIDEKALKWHINYWNSFITLAKLKQEYCPLPDMFGDIQPV